MKFISGLSKMHLFGLLLFSHYGFAQGATSGNLLFSGSEIYITYFLAPQMKMDISDGTTDIEANAKGGLVSKFYVPAIGYRWDYIRNDGFGLALGGRIEIERSFSEATGSATQGGVSADFESDSEGSFSFFLFEPNITHSIGKEAYWYLGVNYPLVISQSEMGEIQGGDPGFQLGMGWDLGNRISNLQFGGGQINFEFYFQIINFKITDVDDQYDGSASLPGAGFRWGVNF